MSGTDTIAALSSGQGRAAVSVVRLSGPATRSCLEALCGSLPKPRIASLRRLRRPSDLEQIDQALVLWFPAPNSFTGEDSAEFQTHGSRSVVSALLQSLTEIPGVRLAEAGEFSRRAFENGKLDLTEVEGLADLIDAETEMQRRQALKQMEGGFRRVAERWRDQLIQSTAWIEALLDFADEGDVDNGAIVRAIEQIREIRAEVAGVLAQGMIGERVRDGFTVVIAGPPNVGKSTLLNALARRDVAIVSPIAGTTRDTLEVHLDLHGWPVTLIDTAGIRDSADPIEEEGIRRARARAASADLVLWMSDQGDESPVGISADVPVIRVHSKCDLFDSSAKHGEELVKISALTGAGIDTLLSKIKRFLQTSPTSETALITRARHRVTLSEIEVSLSRALSMYGARRDDEIVAEEVRIALRALGRLTGRVDVEDVLDALFQGFCIGK